MAIQRPQLASARRERRSYSAATQLGVRIASGDTLVRAGRSCSAVDMSRELVSGVSSLRAGKLRPVRRMEQLNESAGLNGSVGPGHWKSAPAREAPVCAVHRLGARVAHDCAPKPCYLSEAFPFTADVICRICRRHMATREFGQATHWSHAPAERRRTLAEIGDKVGCQKQIVAGSWHACDEDNQPVASYW
jgi:hypothetical protein